MSVRSPPFHRWVPFLNSNGFVPSAVVIAHPGLGYAAFPQMHCNSIGSPSSATPLPPRSTVRRACRIVAMWSILTPSVGNVDSLPGIIPLLILAETLQALLYVYCSLSATGVVNSTMNVVHPQVLSTWMVPSIA